MVWLGRDMRTRLDYILGTERHHFRNLSVWYPIHNSDHYMILGYLRSANMREHTKYLERCMRLPLQTPTILMREYGLYAALQRVIQKTKAWEAQKNSWILADTWRLVGTRVFMHQDTAHYQ